MLHTFVLGGAGCRAISRCLTQEHTKHGCGTATDHLSSCAGQSDLTQRSLAGMHAHNITLFLAAQMASLGGI